jgi:D-alanyl-D-alanine dipeptidase
MALTRMIFLAGCLCALCLLRTFTACGAPAAGGDLPLSDFERKLVAMGFVDVQDLDPTIKVELKYACTANFTGVNLYGELKKGYLRREAAEMLATASRSLKRIRPDLTILLADALRPRHVQWKMWEALKGTDMQNYVADPRRGSMHNHGCAVDVTIVDGKGERLDMGTPMDHFGILSQPRFEEKFLAEKKLTPGQVANRALLRRVMVEAGFNPLAIEWWHFDAFRKEIVRKKYAIVE